MRFLAISQLTPLQVSLYPQIPVLAQLIAEAGWDVSLLVSAPDRVAACAPDVRLLRCRVPGNRQRCPRLVRALYRIGTIAQMVRRRPDVILGLHAAAVDGIIARRILALVGCRCQVLAHFMDYSEPQASWWLRFLVRHPHELAAIIEVEATRLQLRRAWMPDPAQAFVILNACRARRSESGQSPMTSLPLKIVFTGRNYEHIEADVLCRAIGRCSPYDVAFTWLCPEDETQRQSMTRRWSDTVGRGLLRILPGTPRNEWLNALEAYDFGLVWNPVTSGERGLRIAISTCASNKLGDYLAAGLGVIHTGNDGLKFLDGSGAAVAVDPSDPDCLARLTRFLASDISRVDAMRESAWNLHRSWFNLEAQAAPLLAWLSQMR